MTDVIFYLHRHNDGGRLYVSRTFPQFDRGAYMNFLGTVERSVNLDGSPARVFCAARFAQGRLLPTRTELGQGFTE